MRELGIVACMFLSCACAKILEGMDPTTCEDGEDNDLNGRTDCEDDGCASSSVCINEARLVAESARVAAAKKESAVAAAPAETALDDTPTFEIDGLTVKRAQNGADVNWDEAEAYCKDLIIFGFDDWRLPEVDEAVKIVESGRLKGEASYVMWTSTRKGAKRAIIVGMSGAVNDLGIQYRGQCRARCVRGSVAK